MGDVNQSSPRQPLARTAIDMAGRNDPLGSLGSVSNCYSICFSAGTTCSRPNSMSFL